MDFLSGTNSNGKSSSSSNGTGNDLLNFGGISMNSSKSTPTSGNTQSLILSQFTKNNNGITNGNINNNIMNGNNVQNGNGSGNLLLPAEKPNWIAMNGHKPMTASSSAPDLLDVSDLDRAKNKILSQFKPNQSSSDLMSSSANNVSKPHSMSTCLFFSVFWWE